MCHVLHVALSSYPSEIRTPGVGLKQCGLGEVQGLAIGVITADGSMFRHRLTHSTHTQRHKSVPPNMSIILYHNTHYPGTVL